MNHIYSQCKAYFAGGCAVNKHYLCSKASLNSYMVIFILQFQLLVGIFKISKIKLTIHFHPISVSSPRLVD